MDAATRTDLAELDAILLEAVRGGDVLDELLVDDPGKPAEQWWWHLGAIRAGTFSLEHLPAPLRTALNVET